MSYTRSSSIYDQVSEKASNLVSNVADVATKCVTGNVEEVASSFSSEMNETLQTISSGMKRLMTSPPEIVKLESPETSEDQAADQSIEILDTPDNSFDLPGNYLETVPYNVSSISPDSPPSSIFEDSLSENYFSEPELLEIAADGVTSIEKFEEAIKNTRDEILTCDESSEKRKFLVHKLVKYRLVLERIREEEEITKEGIQIKQGHQFTPLLRRNFLTSSTKQFCDRCTKVIWSLIHVTYSCSLCFYQCHAKCIQLTHPKCPSLKFTDDSSVEHRICPQVGLTKQEFRCAQCKTRIHNGSAWGEPRLCDYSGKWFCPACHWNCKSVIPARVIHNWDFSERPVSQASLRFIDYINNKPMFDSKWFNPQLLNFVMELTTIENLRSNLVIMKDYLKSCREAQESKLLRRLVSRQHFIENSNLLSLQDLMDINNGTLISMISEVQQSFQTHIKEECQSCKGKGFICELCKSGVIIFAFDAEATKCRMCKATFHSKCFDKVEVCPRCIRLSARRMSRDECDSAE